MTTADLISLVITPRSRDLGGFSVRRALPDGRRRMVGPFIFFDHMGPAAFAPGHGIDVRPHPHISLATVTFLFEGEIVHRDSLGSYQAIRPGDVNWMLAGHGIVHSERTGDEVRRRGGRLHGIQSWVALPRNQESAAPSFVHHPAATIPRIERPGVDLRVVAGTAYGQRSPVGVLSPTLYVAATLDSGARLDVDAEHPERAVYVLDGKIAVAGHEVAAGSMVVLEAGAVELQALAPTRLVIVGGDAVDGERNIWWNFVASSVEQMEQAKQDWHVRNEARFPKVPGDEHEFIPLPEDPGQPIPRGQGNVTFNP
ncbi:MAG TPA: pirin family protein [Polyangia bacterium]|nr:pirin family protein [Polyangia bacterium]